MKIYVVPRMYIEKMINSNPNWVGGKWIISIYSSEKGIDFSPLPDRFNILKLQFDDISERDKDIINDNYIFFNENHAKQIHEFIKDIKENDTREFYVHCDAGVSRSGAVGYLLNEYFNKYLTLNRIDNESFKMNNNHILPNPLVVRILKNELFGRPFAGIEVNDYTYNEDGERIDHKEII